MELHICALHPRRIPQDKGGARIRAQSLSNLIEKAHRLAASGRFMSVTDIRSHLHREGYSHFELTALNGTLMRKTLRKLIEAARKPVASNDEAAALDAPPAVGKA